MTISLRDPLSAHSEVLDENRRWKSDWYTWLKKIVDDINSATGSGSLIPNPLILPSGSASVSFDSSTFPATAPDLQINDVSIVNTAVGVSLWSADANPSKVVLAKSRGATVNTRGIVSSGDNLGVINFIGDDGVHFQEGANIVVRVDGTPGVGSMPGRLEFRATRPGNNAAFERVRIDSKGNVPLHMEGAISTAATDGFVYIASCAGVPIGVPTTFSGQVPLVYDTLDDRLYIYDAGWKTFASASAGASFFINAAVEFNVSPSNSAATNTTNINNALAAASLSSGRAVVVLPSGTLQVSGIINIPAGVTLMGQGMDATIISCTVTLATLISITGSRSTVRDMGLTVTSTHTVTNMVLVNGTSVGECLITRLNVDPTIGSGSITDGIRLAGVSGGYFNRVSECRIINCTDANVKLNGPNGLECQLSKLDIGGNNISTYGVYVDSGINGYFSMEMVEVLQCVNSGFFLNNCNFSATNCVADTCGGYGWFVGWNTSNGAVGWYASVTNCWGSSSTNHGTTVNGFVSGRGFAFTNAGAAGVIVNITLNSLRAVNNATHGITVDGNGDTTRVSITGCFAQINNTFNAGAGTNPLGHGIFIGDVKASVVGNTASDTQNSGIGINFAAAASGRASGNTATNNAGGQVVIAPTSLVLGLNNDGNNSRTFSQLVPAATAGAGARDYITDANTTTFTTVTTGGGVSVIPVYSDGTNWRNG